MLFFPRPLVSRSARSARKPAGALKFASVAALAVLAPAAGAAVFNFTGAGAIPDGTSQSAGSYGAPRVLTASSTLDEPIVSVNLSLTITHSFVGDVRVILKYQPDDGSGATLQTVIMERTGALNADDTGDSTNLGGTYVFVNGATTIWESAVTLGSTAAVPSGMYGPFVNTLGGTFTPIEQDAPFRRRTGRGTWTLEVSDGALFDTGTVNAASINIVAAPLPCLADFDGDGVVSTPDLVFFLGRFGGGCE